MWPTFKYRYGLETVPNPDPEVRSSRTAQCHTVYPSASPDLQIRIHHCLEVESVTCEDHMGPKKRGASNTHQSQQMDYVTQIMRVGTLIVATIYLQLIQKRYMFRSFTVLQCSHQHCVQPVASDVEVVGYL